MTLFSNTPPVTPALNDRTFIVAPTGDVVGHAAIEDILALEGSGGGGTGLATTPPNISLFNTKQDIQNQGIMLFSDPVAGLVMDAKLSVSTSIADARGFFKSAPTSSKWKIFARIKDIQDNTNGYNGAYLSARNSATGKTTSVGITNTGSDTRWEMIRWNADGTFNSVVTHGIPAIRSSDYTVMEFDGTNIYFGFSGNRALYSRFSAAQEAVTDWLGTLDEVGFLYQNQRAVGTQGGLSCDDYVEAIPPVAVVQKSLGPDGGVGTLNTKPVPGNILLAFVTSNQQNPALIASPGGINWNRVPITVGSRQGYASSRVCPDMVWRAAEANDTTQISVCSASGGAGADVTIIYEISGIAASAFAAAIEGCEMTIPLFNPPANPPVTTTSNSSLAIVFSVEHSGADTPATFDSKWMNYAGASPAELISTADIIVAPAGTALAANITLGNNADPNLYCYGVIALKS